MSTPAKAFLLGLLTAEILDSEEITFVLAHPEESTIDVECDSIPFQRFRITVQEVNA